MIVIKHSFFFVISMMALPAANLRADSRRAVTLPMTQSATVADVVQSTHNGHTGFNIPLCPQFTKRAFWQSAPWSLHEYPAMHTDKLTTAAMIRFITQSPQLFKNSIKEAAYKNALNAAIAAHKTWFSNKTEENAAKLHQAEDVVMAYLQTLRLSNSATRKAIEAILSTPTHWLARRLVGSFFLPFRSSLVSRKKDGQEQQTVSISGSCMTVLKASLLNLWVAYYLTHSHAIIPLWLKRKLMALQKSFEIKFVLPFLPPEEALQAADEKGAESAAIQEINNGITLRNSQRRAKIERLRPLSYIPPRLWNFRDSLPYFIRDMLAPLSITFHPQAQPSPDAVIKEVLATESIITSSKIVFPRKEQPMLTHQELSEKLHPNNRMLQRIIAGCLQILPNEKRYAKTSSTEFINIEDLREGSAKADLFWKLPQETQNEISSLHAIALLEQTGNTPQNSNYIKLTTEQKLCMGDVNFDSNKYKITALRTVFGFLSAASIYAWMKDHKLTPEPAGGIKVTINLS